MPRKISILLIEDDPIISEMLRYNLEKENFSVLSVDDGKKGLALAKRENPDLILLDLLLPGMHGFDICRSIRTFDDETPILMLTALGEEIDKVEGLEAGADDYVTKPFGMAELMARIKANLRRVGLKPTQDDRVIKHEGLLIDTAKHMITVNGKEVKLRNKEFDLLVLLASNPDKAFTREDLASKVWGHDFMSSSRTIDVHIRRIRQALESGSDYHFIHTLHGFGYRFRPEMKS